MSDTRMHTCAGRRRTAVLAFGAGLTLLGNLPTAHTAEVRTGADAFGTWEDDAPGVRRHIRPADLPPPTHADNDPEAPDFERLPKVVDAPQGTLPDVPDGFAVQVLASGLNQPRVIRIAPNGDIFVAESGSGRVLVFPGDAPAGAPATPDVFAENLDRPYGVVFRPISDPQHVYVGAANQVVRFPYGDGDREATGPAEVVIADIPHRAALDARPGGFPGRRTPLRLDRLGFQCRRRNAGKDPGGDQGL